MKNTNLTFVFTALLGISILVCSCSSVKGTGDVVTEARPLGTIISIDLEMDANVFLIRGDSQSVVIKAQQNILDVLMTDLKGDKLKIKTAKSISVTDPVQIWITVKSIEDIELDGAGSIVSTTEFNSEDVSADVSGSGKISLVLNSEKFEGVVSGSGDLYLAGKVAKGDMSISGSGNIYATGCEIDKCKADVDGSGTAKLNVTSELNAGINGSGAILYSGNPQKVKSDINGSGRIAKLE